MIRSTDTLTAKQFWNALKERCAATPDKKALVMVRFEDVVAALASPVPSTQEGTSGWPPQFEMMKLQARPAEGGDWIDIFPGQLEWMVREGNSVRAIEADGADSATVSPCSHQPIIGFDGKWHCQRCGAAIEMAVAHTSTEGKTL